jgi:hypothetical protein
LKVIPAKTPRSNTFSPNQTPTAPPGFAVWRWSRRLPRVEGVGLAPKSTSMARTVGVLSSSLSCRRSESRTPFIFAKGLIVLSSMRDRGFVDRGGRPAIPELFEEMADSWSPEWLPLGSVPRNEPDYFRLSGTLGAIWQQAPVVATADWPPELYVKDRSELRGVILTYGARSASPAVGRVAVCPSPYGWSVAAEIPSSGFPVANHVVVALDLAQDRGRGREILDGWTPEGHVRVW